MRKYDMRICSCGRIHMIPMEKIDKAIENNKNFLYICGGCGRASIIGADIEQDWYEEDKLCYNMYSGKVFEYKDGSINVEDFTEHDNKKAISEIFYSHGIKVPMMTGEYARSYFCDQFADMWYPDFYKIQRGNITLEEVKEFVDEFTKNQIVVNMNRFIRETPDEYLKEISCYLIRAFDWTGTKYERK